MQSRRRRSLLIVASLVCVLCGASRVCAQGAPRPLPINLIGANELNESQIAELKAWVTYWSDMLNTATDPADVERARAQLIAPLNQPDPARMISPRFRQEYSMAATPQMEKALAGGDLHRSVNALLVLSQLGDDRAVNVILRQVDPQGQPRWQTRDAAASAARVLLQGRALDARKIKEVAQKLRDAAMREENGYVLRHLFGGLNAADNPALTPEDREAVRKLMVDALGAVASRLPGLKEPVGPVVDAAAAAVGALRDKFLPLQSEEKRRIGPVLGPILGKLLAHALAKWPEGHANTSVTQRMATLIGACQTLLQVIDETLRPGQAKPSGDLTSTWNSADKSGFDTGVTAWLDLLGKSPYKP